MKNFLSLLLLCFTLASAAQSQPGMQFEHGTTWAEIKAKAKAEKKFIFVDAFTTWCGPCKVMARDIFPLKEVGEFYNANFINVKVQLDTSKTDDGEVKRWYKDAHDIMTTYKVNAFPTYLFFNPEGELVHRELGSSPALVFINKGKDALNPEKQYYTLKRKYEAGEKSPAVLLNLVKAAQAASDRQFAPIIIKDYLGTQTDLYTKDNLRLLMSATTKRSDVGFPVFRNNAAKVDSIIGKGASNSVVINIVQNEVLFPQIYPKGMKADVDWKAAEAKLMENYADIKDELLLPMKINHYNHFKNWSEFSESVNEYVGKFGPVLSREALNNYAWSIFQNCDDMKCIQSALSWSKSTLGNRKNPMFLDTYANLLYKSGQKEDAIKVQEEAVKLAKDPRELQEVVDKMKRGEKTW